MKPIKTPIKVCHIHFDISKNKGDEAIVLGIKQELERVFASNLEYSSWDIYYLKPLKYPKIADNKMWKSSIKNFDPDRFWGRLGLAGFWQNKQRQTRQKLLEFLNQQDLIVIGGGGVFYGGLLPFDDDLINQIKPKIVVFGAGYNQLLGIEFLDEKTKKSILNLVNKSALCGLRDQNSLEIISNLGSKNVQIIAENKIELVPDPALVLSPQPVAGFAPDPGFFHLGVNIAMHSPLLAQKLIDLPQTYLDYIYKLKNLTIDDSKLDGKLAKKLENGLVVHLFVHTQVELDFAILMLKKIGKNDKIWVQVHNRVPAELKWLYSQTDFNLTMMLHSAIFAFCACKPFLNLGYDVKNKAFMELVERDKNYIDVVDSGLESKELVENIIQKTISAINSFDEVKNQQKLASLQAQIQTFSQKMAELFSPCSNTNSNTNSNTSNLNDA